MKINWASGIVIAIISFIGFIMYFVITMSIDKTYSHDLVTDKYYQQELTHQKQINAAKNTLLLKENISLLKTKKGLLIQFPKNFFYKKIKGNVFLYRPSNKQLDFEIPISLTNAYLLVPEKRLLDGRWNIIISWNYQNKEYLFKKEFVY